MADELDFGTRSDGSRKWTGWIGVHEGRGANAGTSVSEMSIGVPVRGKEMDIPTMVPGLDPDEFDSVLRLEDPKDLPDSAVKKATGHAEKMIDAGRSPFLEYGEQSPYLIGESEDSEERQFTEGEIAASNMADTFQSIGLSPDLLNDKPGFATRPKTREEKRQLERQQAEPVLSALDDAKKAEHAMLSSLAVDSAPLARAGTVAEKGEPSVAHQGAPPPEPSSSQSDAPLNLSDVSPVIRMEDRSPVDVQERPPSDIHRESSGGGVSRTVQRLTEIRRERQERQQAGTEAVQKSAEPQGPAVQGEQVFADLNRESRREDSRDAATERRRQRQAAIMNRARARQGLPTLPPAPREYEPAEPANPFKDAQEAFVGSTVPQFQGLPISDTRRMGEMPEVAEPGWNIDIEDRTAATAGPVSPVTGAEPVAAASSPQPAVDVAAVPPAAFGGQDSSETAKLIREMSDRLKAIEEDVKTIKGWNGVGVYG